MKLQWVGIYDRGNLQKERVHLRATVDLDLSFYIIFDSLYTGPTAIQAAHKTCYWFGPQKIKAGENVILYSRHGVASSERGKDGAVYHFLFRDANFPIYPTNLHCAVLFEVSGWSATTPTVPF